MTNDHPLHMHMHIYTIQYYTFRIGCINCRGKLCGALTHLNEYIAFGFFFFNTKLQTVAWELVDIAVMQIATYHKHQHKTPAIGLTDKQYQKKK